MNNRRPALKQDRAKWATIILFSLSAVVYSGIPLKPSKHARLTFPNGRSIIADVADTPQDRERGLMYRRDLPRDYGLLFVFPRQMPIQFWMKNTLVPLDIVFIGADKKIAVIHKNVKASTAATSAS